MTLEMLTAFSKDAKKLKSDIIVLYNGVIYGVDTSFSIFKELVVGNKYGNEIIACSIKALNSYINDPSTIVYNELAKMYFSNNPFFIQFYFDSVREKIGVLDSHKLGKVIPCGNIKETNDIQTLMKMKTSDGILCYRKEGYVVTLYKTLLNIKKNDTVELTIYDNHPKLFLCEFLVGSKKDIVKTRIMCSKI